MVLNILTKFCWDPLPLSDADDGTGRRSIYLQQSLFGVLPRIRVTCILVFKAQNYLPRSSYPLFIDEKQVWSLRAQIQMQVLCSRAHWPLTDVQRNLECDGERALKSDRLSALPPTSVSWFPYLKNTYVTKWWWRIVVVLMPSGQTSSRQRVSIPYLSQLPFFRYVASLQCVLCH